MARIKLKMPDQKIYETNHKITLSQINYGGHLGNDSVLTLCHEARLQFIKSEGYDELNYFGAGLIQSDAAVVYKAEAFHGDEVIIEIFLDDISDYGFDFYYKITKDDKIVVALVKTGMIFFDYKAKKIMKTPKQFKERY
jgi:acyl-CoA thioesterase FadM